MRIYVAGALFSEAERAWLDGLAARLRGEGFECFVPHEQFGELTELTPAEVYRIDAEGVRSANVLLAWLDGSSIDDGTACEIGMSAELVERDERRYRGIVGLVSSSRSPADCDHVARWTTYGSTGGSGRRGSTRPGAQPPRRCSEVACS